MKHLKLVDGFLVEICGFFCQLQFKSQPLQFHSTFVDGHLEHDSLEQKKKHKSFLKSTMSRRRSSSFFLTTESTKSRKPMARCFSFSTAAAMDTASWRKASITVSNRRLPAIKSQHQHKGNSRHR